MTKLLLFDFFGVIVFSGETLFLNQELLQYIKERKSDYKTAILSSSGMLLKNKLVLSKVEKYFDEIFLSADPEIYKLVTKKFKINPQEIIFIDDMQQRVSAAKAAGCKAILFENNQQLFKVLTPLL